MPKRFARRECVGEPQATGTLLSRPAVVAEGATTSIVMSGCPKALMVDDRVVGGCVDTIQSCVDRSRNGKWKLTRSSVATTSSGIAPWIFGITQKSEQ